MRQPLISVIIPTYNRSSIISNAIDSVLNQTFKKIEILVIDDYSTDKTEQIVKNYEDQRVKYFKNKHKKGAQGARNTGLGVAKGKYIAGLDDDDVWHPKRLELMIDAYKDKYAYVTTDVYVETAYRKTVVNRNRLITFEEMLFHNAAGNQILTTKDKILGIGGFDEDLTAAQDYDLFLRLNERYGDAINVCEPLQTITEVQSSGERISDNAFQGYFHFFKKHKSKFNKEQKKYQLLNIRKAQQKPVSLKLLMTLCPSNFKYREFKEYLKHKIGLNKKMK